MGYFLVFFLPHFFFWNSLKEVGKEGAGRADAVQRSFGVSGDPQRALPKKPAPSLGGFTASQQRFGKRSHLKDSSSWRQRKEEKKKMKTLQNPK